MLLCAFFLCVSGSMKCGSDRFFGATILSHTYTNTCHKSIHMFGKSLDPYAKADWFEHGLILNWVVPHIEWHFNESVHPLATPSTNYCIHSHYPQTCSSTPSLHINCTLLGFRASWHDSCSIFQADFVHVFVNQQFLWYCLIEICTTNFLAGVRFWRSYPQLFRLSWPLVNHWSMAETGFG